MSKRRTSRTCVIKNSLRAFQGNYNPHHRVEFVQIIIDLFWKRWNRDVFPSLVPRKKWQVEKRNVRPDDIVVVSDPNALRGKWSIGRVLGPLYTTPG